jgi:hypothetical protein
MADQVIRFIQCPYCNKKYGVRFDQEVERCFACGGILNLTPKEVKSNVVASIIGKIGSAVKEQIDETRRQNEAAAQEEPFSSFTDDVPLADEEEEVELDSMSFNKESIVPLKERLFADRGEEPDDFDPLSLIESDMLEEESIFPESVPVPFDPVEILDDIPFMEHEPEKQKVNRPTELFDPIARLRPAADDIPTYPRREEETEEPTFFTRQRIILFSVILGGILILIVLMFIRDIMG